MKKELDPIEFGTGKKFWENVFEKIDFRTDLILPVEVKNDETGELFGKFYISLENGDKEKFIQFENFSSPEFAEIFFQEIHANWIIFPGGVYRVKV